jgi:hypothetical protein
MVFHQIINRISAGTLVDMIFGAPAVNGEEKGVDDAYKHPT